MRLDDEELHQVLARAQEIQNTSLVGPAARADIEIVIQAAEEVGIPRAAVERALRERFGLPAQLPRAGELTFARSADGKFYVAEVLAAAPDEIRVRFLRGSEHTVTPDQLRPAAFLPGAKVQVHWPWWGPWTCSVISYDAAKATVKVSDGWGETKTFPVAEVWLNAPRAPAVPGGGRARISARLIGAGAAIGTLIGGVITALLLG